MRHISLKFIGRDLLIGLITASFVYSPDAFAKPNNRASKKAVPYAQMLKLIKTPGAKKASDIADAVKPMFKKREYRLFLKDTMRSWDSKVEKLVVGRNYFRFRSKGKTYFARFVDRGPIAFVLNNKPVLWKDLLFYSKMRSRVHEITTGRKLTRVSMLENFLNYFSSSAYGRGDNPNRFDDDPTTVVPVEQIPVEPVPVEPMPPVDQLPQVQPNPPVPPGGTACITKEILSNFNQTGGLRISGITCPSNLKQSCPTPQGFSAGLNVLCSDTRAECATSFPDSSVVPGMMGLSVTQECAAAVLPPEKETNWMVIGLIGALFAFLLLRNKKKDKKDPKKPKKPKKPNKPDKPKPPVPPYVPGGESTCPPVGSRGITQEERDKLPGCNKSNCVEDGTCVGSGKGRTVD